MTIPAPLTRESALEVLAHFPGLADGLTDFAPLPTGLYNENARLTAAGRDLVLKKLPAGRDPERLRFSLALQSGLAAAGFPCPQVLANGEDALVTHCAGAAWTLQAWAAGDHLAGEARRDFLAGGGARVLGELVGRLHGLAADLDDRGHLPRSADPRPVDRILADTLRIADGFLKGPALRPSPAFRLRLKPGKDGLEQDIVRWTPVLRAAVDALRSWPGARAADLAPTGPGHGDINWENLLFDGTGAVTVLDFDNAGRMPTCHDAAAACAVICGADGSRQTEFAAGYATGGGTPLPAAALPWLVLLKYVRSMAWQIGSRDQAADRGLARSWLAFLGENMQGTLAALGR